ncbi:MAG: DUF1292 domain-containing protein [Tenericutes bacterium]|nr:DUF1292 domain-containing protein [Mycoplasmatota bacterium]
MTEFTAINHNNEYVLCKIIAEFDYDNKKYILYIDNEKNVYAAYLDGQDLKQIFNQEEFELVNKVYQELSTKELKPDFIEYASIFHKGIEYKTVFDLNDNRRYFYELRNNRYEPVDNNLQKYFDSIYNSEIDILYNGNNDKLELARNVTKKVVKIGNVTIAVIIAANISFTGLKTINLDRSFLQNIEAIKDIYTTDERDHKIIMSYIDKNTRLSNEDKEFILSMNHFFEENEKYFNMSEIKKNLINLRIIYDKDNQENHKMSNRVKGYYTKAFDKITIFYSDKMDNDIITKKVVFHEVMHAISNKGYVSKGNLGLALTEGVNELMAEEYLNTYSDTYNKGQTYARIMCELIGPEKVKESFFGNNIDMVLEELSSICGTKKDAQKFISLLDDEARCDTTLMTSNNREEKIDALETKRRVSPVIDTYIRIYYESKFNRKIDEDKLMLAYMDSLRLTNNLQSEFYHENNIEKINVVKHYFNSELLNIDKQVTVEYIYKNIEKKNINKYDIELTNEGKYRRTFSNGKYIDYDIDPNLIEITKASYSFPDEVEKGFSR